MVVVGDHLADAVAEADTPGAARRGGQEDLRRRAVRILFQEMMLDRPGVIDAEFIGERDLVEGLLEQAMLGLLGQGRGSCSS